MNITDYEAFEADLAAAAASTESNQGAKDLYVEAKEIGEIVGQFLSTNSIANVSDDTEVPTVACEGISTAVAGLGTTDILDLVANANIDEENRGAAAQMILRTLAKHESSNSVGGLWTNQTMSMEQLDPDKKLGNVVGLLGGAATNYMNQEANYSLESFGIDMDKATPDLKLDITIGLLRFKADLTASLLNTKSAAQPVVRYTRDNEEIYDLNDASVEPVEVLELRTDASILENKLVPIVPLFVNKVANEVISDNVLATGVEANILKLSINSAPGMASVNHTDLVAEGVTVSSIRMTIVNGSDTEIFSIPMNKNNYKLVWSNDSDDNVMERVLAKSFEAYITNGAVQADGSASVIFADAASDREGIKVAGTIFSKIDLKTGIVTTTITATGTFVQLDGLALSGPFATREAASASYTGTGYSLDASFRNDNLGRASQAGRGSRQVFWYEIIPGKVYVYDYALGQKNSQNSVSMISNMLRNGQGKRSLNIVREILFTIADETEKLANGELSRKQGPNKRYVAGSRVDPRVITKDLDLAHSLIVSNNDFSKSENIRRHALIFFNALISDLHQLTGITDQVSGSAIHYRCLTTGFILDNVLSQNYQPDHTVMQGGVSNGKVEQSIVLNSGVVLDIVTTPDVSMDSTIIGYPWFSPADSELNFAQNHDNGILSGHYANQGPDNKHSNRIHTSTRETIIPTNPMGFVVTVKNLRESVFMV